MFGPNVCIKGSHLLFKCLNQLSGGYVVTVGAGGGGQYAGTEVGSSSRISYQRADLTTGDTDSDSDDGGLRTYGSSRQAAIDGQLSECFCLVLLCTLLY